MNRVVIGRPVEGITLNGELEFLLNDSGVVWIFDSPEQAKEFLIAAGFDPEELHHMTVMESCGICCRCRSPLFHSRLPGYAYQCFTCNQDFYKFEQIQEWE